MSNFNDELSKRFASLLSAITYEIPAIDPRAAAGAIDAWGKVEFPGAVNGEPSGTLLALSSFLSAIADHLGLGGTASSDHWLNSDSPLSCGALHDLLDLCLEALRAGHRSSTAAWIAEVQSFSRVLRHVAETGESLGQARARVARRAQGLRLVA
ncbi:TPA: hypothetical protein ACKP9S_002804 [Pseudomonas aeruginosa]